MVYQHLWVIDDKTILVEEQPGDKGIHILLKDISLKVNVEGEDMLWFWCLVLPPFMLVYIWKGKWRKDVRDAEKRTFKTKQ